MEADENQYRRFNNLFKTDEQIDEMKKYLRTKKAPQLAFSALNRFLEKASHCKMQNRNLLYDGLIVVYPSNIIQTLEYEYHNNKILQPFGANKLYKHICSKYTGISRIACRDFLQNQAVHQLTKKPEKTSRPVTASKSQELWACDLIDMSFHQNNTRKYYRYILSVLDVFSKKIWVARLKNKTANSVWVAFLGILNRSQTQPKTLLCDNGGEFEDSFAANCKERGIVLRHTRSYSASSNPVERYNAEIRRVLRAYALADGSLDWSTRMSDIEASLNKTYNEAIQGVPDEIWTNVNRRKRTPKETLILKQNADRIAEFKKTDRQFQLGDKVRISMAALYSGIRKMNKTGDGKHVIVQYTPGVYTISRISIAKRNGVDRAKYELKNAAGEIFQTVKGGTRLFFASQLQLIKNIDPEGVATDITLQKAMKLNKTKEVSGDAPVIHGGRLYFNGVNL